MTISKESYVDLQEKYEKVKKLIEEDSKTDPENEPYLSKYSARQLLIGMKANIENLLRSCSSGTKEHLKLTGMLGATYLYLGIIAIDTEELSTGEKHLKRCEEIIKDYEDKPEIILITLNMLNQFGILWSQRDPKKSIAYFEKAASLYNNFKSKDVAPVDIQDLFKANIETYDVELGSKNLEKVFTLTLYYIAQIYGALKDALKSSIYCHITLKRQLESGEFDPIDWALNAATLSQFFMEKNGFKQARHHLACSSLILDRYEAELNQTQEHNEEFDAKVENFKHRSADVARCWAKYGLLLLSTSRDRLLNRSDNGDDICSFTSDLAKLSLDSHSTVSKEDLEHLYFPSLDVSSYENQITDEFILTLQDARKVFLNIQMWLNKAHSYYTLDNLASDYVDIVLDQSQMYRNLLFFDDNPENQAKMHKRRADLLENVIREINPTYYMQYCRQIWFDLGQTYGDILDIKMEKLRETNDRPSPHALGKINHLVDKSISHFSNFVNSFKDVSTQQLPRSIDKDLQKPFLQALFHIGALWSRYITLDKAINLENIKKSLEFYKKVADYCNENPEIADAVSAELNICKEMIRLLPIKILKLQQEVAQQT